MVQAWSGLMLLVAIGLAVAGPATAKWVMVAMCLNQLLPAFFVFVPRTARAYLAYRRGEEVLLAVPLAAAPVATPRRTVDNSLASVGRVLALGSGVLLGLAALSLLGGVLMLIFRGVGWVALLVGVFAFVLGNIGMTAGEDLGFLYETKGQVAAHLTNSKTSLGIWNAAQLVVALALLLIAIARFAM